MSTEKTNEREEVRLDEKVILRSIAPWTTGSPRKTTIGDISIPAKGTMRVSREEIIAQAQNGNVLIAGIDGLGSHATWHIEDEYTRKELGFDDDDRKQTFLSKDEVKRIFELKTKKSFEDNIIKNVKTRAEKAYLLDCIKALKLNDYERISFCIEYSGMNFAQ